MATDKKRVIVYLDQSDKQKLDHIAEDLGCSVSRLCGDVLLQSMPHLETMSEALKLARTHPQKAIEMIKQAGGSAQAELLKEMETFND